MIPKPTRVAAPPSAATHPARPSALRPMAELPLICVLVTVIAPYTKSAVLTPASTTTLASLQRATNLEVTSTCCRPHSPTNFCQSTLGTHKSITT